MASMKLGSKSEVFHLDGRTWFCSTGLPTDVVFEVGEMAFHLHKFPLLSRSGVLENLIAELPIEDEKDSVIQLDDVPGGARAFLLVAKFCYGVRIELTASNIVGLRCAAEYLRMNEDYGEGNLILHTENFLNEIFASWNDSIKALETCEDVLRYAEEYHVVSRCIVSLAMKACADPSLFSWPMSGSEGTNFWNGIGTTAKSPDVSEDWWYEDVSSLSLPLYKRFILAVESRGMKPENIAGSVMHYARKHLSLLGSRHSSFDDGYHMSSGSVLSSSPFEEDQKDLLEEIVELLPVEKSVTPTKFLLMLLRTSMKLQANPACRENLERKIGYQLDQAALEDLLIPNMVYTAETLYDIDCVQRILDHFMLVDRDPPDSSMNYIVEEGEMMGGSHPLTPITMVANLIDDYLAEVAPDVNLKLPKFQSLASVIPEYARPLDDGIYRAIDIYLKAHPWLTDSEREHLCRLMNCQKLSLEACTHAAQNERLPIRVIVQVLYFEQLRLRTSVAGWFFVSDNINDSSQNPSGALELARTEEAAAAAQHRVVGAGDMKERVCELEKECLSMKQDLEKLVKTKASWNFFSKFRLKSKSCEKTSPGNLKESSPPGATKEISDHKNGELKE